MQVEPKMHNKGKVLNIRSIVQKLATVQRMSTKGKHQGKFWKVEVRRQVSAASVASVVSSVVRMFGFSAGQLVESPMWSHLVCEDQETEHRASVLLVLTTRGITWLFLVPLVLE